MVTIPDQITTHVDALQALAAYSTWRGALRCPHPGADGMAQAWHAGYAGPPLTPWRPPRDARAALQRLRESSGAPPVVYAHLDGGKAVRVPLAPLAANDRGRHVVRVPRVAAAEAEDPHPDETETDPPISAVAHLAYGLHVVRAYGARIAQLADAEDERGHGRQAIRYRHEAIQTLGFARDTEQDALVTLATTWLADWRSQAARYDPHPTPHPLVRPVRLR